MINKIILLPIAVFTALLCVSVQKAPEINSVTPSSTSIFRDESEAEVKSYYSSLSNGLKGDDLLSSLQPILTNGQAQISASTIQNGDWKYFLVADRDWNLDPLTASEESSQSWKIDNVKCSILYDEDGSFTFVKANSPGNQINREHVFPKSYGFQVSGSYAPYAGSDLHNLHMGEAKNNQNGHNNYPYGNVANKSSATKITSTITSAVTGYLGDNGSGTQVYEPLDKDKGDIARSIFYMAARYHTYVNYGSTSIASPSLGLSDTPDSFSGSKTAEDTKTTPCYYGMLSDLLSWNNSDPVDDHEIHRNNLVYNAIQKNRNPFIDYPSWANIAYGSSSSGIDLTKLPSQVGKGSQDNTPSKDVNTDVYYSSNGIDGAYSLLTSKVYNVSGDATLDNIKALVLKDNASYSEYSYNAAKSTYIDNKATLYFYTEPVITDVKLEVNLYLSSNGENGSYTHTLTTSLNAKSNITIDEIKTKILASYSDFASYSFNTTKSTYSDLVANLYFYTESIVPAHNVLANIFLSDGGINSSYYLIYNETYSLSDGATINDLVTLVTGSHTDLSAYTFNTSKSTLSNSEAILYFYKAEDTNFFTSEAFFIILRVVGVALVAGVIILIFALIKRKK